jgi:SP family general alpha glucoside:H+ symporter-like MFS transporter
MPTYIEDTKEPEKATVIEEKIDTDLNNADFLIENAKEAANDEKVMSLKQGLKLYPKAAFWSFSISLAIVMVGYDYSLLGSFYAFPVFQEKFGSKGANGKYIISAAWQSGLSNGVVVGEIIGLFMNGIISERFGYRKTMMATFMSLNGLIFIPFFAPNVEVLLVGQILNGIGWGIFITLTTTYASEVCPIVLRYYLTTWVNVCYVIGDIMAIVVLRSLLSRKDQWGFRIPFALEWIFPLPLFFVVFFAPESPWWLVRRNKTEEAIKSVQRLTSQAADPNFDASKQVAMMIHSVALEKRINESTSYLECFKGVDLRRTEIACIVWMIQTICGSGLLSYATYFFEMAGMSTTNAFNMSLAKQCVAFLGTMCSWVVMNFIGRRTLFLTGLASMSTILLIIGFVSLAPADNTAAIWAIGGLLLALMFAFDVSIGPAPYAIVPEMSSTRLRTKTTVLARNLYNIATLCQNIVIAYILNPEKGNWKGKVGFYYGGIAALCFVYAYFRLPETKGRSYAELEVLFEKKISARKFKSTEVDPFEVNMNREVEEEIKHEQVL